MQLSQANDVLFLLMTDRTKRHLREAALATLKVRADLESGAMTPEQAKLKLSDLMGMDAQARALLRQKLREASESEA